MDYLTFFITITAIYLVLLFFDSFFKSCMHYPYEAFLNGTGLTVKFFRLQWYTTAFNRTIFKVAHRFPRFFRASFDVGVCVSLILLPLMFILHFGGSLFSSNESEKEIVDYSDVGFAIMLPGINLPLEEVWYYMGAIGLSATIHEMGHAFAAVLEDVPVTGFGFHVWFVFPLAYTVLNTDQIQALKLWRKLRIFCGGIWHNVALSLLAYVIFSSLSVIFMPLYATNYGVIITHISRGSSLLGPKGLKLGDIITQVNHCTVNNVDDWYDCLLNTIKHHPAYCITEDFVRHNDESVPLYHSNEGLTECCDANSPGNLCFEHISESASGILELQQFMCLNVRNVVQHSVAYCQRRYLCDQSFCIKPQLNNATTVLQIVRKNQPDVMYIGHPADVSRTIQISEFIPKTSMFGPNFPDALCTFLKYTVVFSFGQAFVNVIPIFGMDGQHIFGSIINNSLISIVPERKQRDTISFCIACIGSGAFILTVIKILWASVTRSSY